MLSPEVLAFAPDKYALAGTIFAGDGSQPKQDHAVLVDGERIKAIIPTTDARDRKIIALPHAFIIPGIINCHVHRIHSATERRDRYLLKGVTSIGDTASPLAAMPALLNSPSGETATAALAGPMLCPPGGYPLPVHSPEHGLVVDSPTHGREQVRRLADLGATMVKLAFEPGTSANPWPMFDRATADAICDEARRHNLTIRCHVEDLDGLEPALNAGVHTIEHVPYRWIDCGKNHPILQTENGQARPIARYRELLDRMARNNVILTPTLDVFSRSAWDGPRLYEPVRYFADRGGTIAVGNDFPYRRTDAGMPLREMTLLGKTGMDSAAILTAATRNSAAACGFRQRGILAPGTAADCLVLYGNPLEDLNLLSKPGLIIKDGKQVC